MRVQWLKQLDAGGGIEACPRSWPGCSLNGMLEENAKLAPGRAAIMAAWVRLAIRREGKNVGDSNC